MKTKLWLCLVLVISIIFGCFSLKSYGAVMTEEQFVQWLLSEKRLENYYGIRANYSTYVRYNLVVYGEPHGDTKSGTVNPAFPGPHKRFLGYDLYGNKVTNPYFPEDSSTGKYYNDFNYLPVAKAKEVWDKVDSDVKSYMLSAQLQGSRVDYSRSFTLNKIGGENYGKPLSIASWKSEGNIYLNHRDSAGTWYLDLTVAPMVGDSGLSGKISTPTNTYTIKANEDIVEIPVTTVSTANLKGQAKARHIKTIRATAQGASNEAQGVISVTQTTKYQVKREHLQVGNNVVLLTGSAYLLTIFDDEYVVPLSHSVNVIVEPKGEAPYVATKVSANPDKKKFENQDVKVKLTVSGELKNYTDADNIKEWVFYAREKEAEEALIKKNYEKTLESSTSFDFVIPSSKVKGNTYTQPYVVRARAYFVSPVNGKEYLDAPAEVAVFIYKEDPPSSGGGGGNEPPVARIDAENTVMAGVVWPISGAGSYDPDGIITQYNWAEGNLRVENEERAIQGPGAGRVWYDVSSIGTNMIALSVIDDGGAAGYTNHFVNVLPPIPQAKLRIEGALKENRRITLDATGSWSPEMYPIQASATRITITSITGDQNSIRYHGNLNGTLSKDILIKEAGKYKVTLYVRNTAGYDDEIEEIIEVKPDQAPIVDFSAFTRTFRDTYDNLQATITLKDISYSPDQDLIDRRIWRVIYNHDNAKTSEGYPDFDGKTFFSFVDTDMNIGEKVTIEHNGISYIITREDRHTVTIKTPAIGYYLVEMQAIERFGQYTIEEFVTADDRRRGNTDWKHKLEKTIKVDNRAPYVDFAP